MIKITLAQINVTVGAIETNAEKILAAINEAKKNNANIIVFPELALCGYPPEDLLLRQDFIEQCDKALEKLAHNITGIDVLLGYPCLRDGKAYNAAGWFRDQHCIAEYYKHELPNTGLFDEERYFKAGKAASIVEYQGVQFGILICEDLWHEKAILQSKAAGAQCILSLNASPFRFDKHQHRIEVLKARANSASLPIFYVNYVGSQDEFLFDGQSTAVSSSGEVQVQAPAFKETLLHIDYQHPNIVPQTIASIPKLELIYEGLVVATRDYIEKNHFPGAIIGSSGGIDSALTLAIAVDAIGADRVHAVLMPSQYTADMSNEDAVLLAKNLNISYDVLAIESIYHSFMQTLNPCFDGRATDTTEENLQARIRGTLLMALSNKTGKLVLTTGNKSEMAVGYATLYGDMAGGFAVLKDVYKTVVYELARYVNRKQEIIPERIITRAPSAELAPDQKDQDSLPPYEQLDDIIKAFVEDDLSMAEIIARGHDKKTVARIIQLIQRNEYKRRQAPPGTRITKRAFGRNRRYPITSGFKS